MRKSAIAKLSKYVSKIEGIIADLSEVIDNEQNYYEERSDTWQECEKGEEFCDRIYQVESLRDDLENALNEIEDLLNE
jgi:hypothetical protein